MLGGLRRLICRLRAFRGDGRGNIAIVFALALVPMILATGAGIDFTRAMIVRSQMSSALDAAALAVGSSSGLSASQMKTLAQNFFSANYKLDSSYGTVSTLTVTTSSQQIVIAASCSVPTIFIKLAGIGTIPIATSTTVVWGQIKLWVSLVLDNTGSMAGDKITALKSASKQLLTMLQNAATTDGDVRVSVVPFARNVKLNYTSSTAPSWISFTYFSAAPSVTVSSNVGPGSTCPFTKSTSDPSSFGCVTPTANNVHCNVNNNSDGNTDCLDKIPSSGTYKGYICPSATTSGHYYNGCFNSVSNGKGGYTHTWVSNSTTTWGGCVADRDQNYDVMDTTPTSTSTYFPADNSPGCPSASIMALTSVGTSASSNLTVFNNKIDSMVASGSTNQTIGLAWGWQTMTQGLPMSPPSLPDGTSRIVILLSDGLNTQDRWYGTGYYDGGNVDARMAKVCANAKADGVTIYTVLVMSGSSAILQSCASDTSKYFELTAANQITSAFVTIGKQITNLRVAQ